MVSWNEVVHEYIVVHVVVQQPKMTGNILMKCVR